VIQGFKDFGVTSLIFWGHVTSSITWPLDSAYVVSYWWSIGTMRLSCTVSEMQSFKFAFAYVKGQKFTVHALCHGRVSKITAYLEFLGPHCLFTLQLLWGYDDD